MIDLSEDLRLALLSPEVRAVLAELVAEAVAKALDGMPFMDELLDVDAAAVLLRMSPAAVRKAAARGGLRTVRLGRRLRFHRRDLLQVGRRGRGPTK